MARYYPISPLFWADPVVRAWGDKPTLLALYLLTCEHRNLEGLYRLPWGYVSDDLGWQDRTVTAARKPLLADGFIEYDNKAQVVFVRNALKYQAPKSAKRVIGAIRVLQEVPKTPLLASLLAVADDHATELAKAIRKAFRDQI